MMAARKTSRKSSDTDRSKSQADHAAKAMKLKQKNDQAPARPDSGRRSDEGMQPLPRTGVAPSGALNAEGHRPVLERSRKVR